MCADINRTMLSWGLALIIVGALTNLSLCGCSADRRGSPKERPDLPRSARVTGKLQAPIPAGGGVPGVQRAEISSPARLATSYRRRAGLTTARPP